MANCTHFQTQMLDDLYDLLEEDDRLALREHLEQCGACREALARAQSQQRLLARAAKAEFNQFRFQPPAPKEVEEETTALPLRPAHRSWRGWAIAASILVLLSLGVPSGWWTVRYLQEETGLQQASAHLAAAKAQADKFAAEHQLQIAHQEQTIQETQRQLEQLSQEVLEKWNALQRKIQDRQLNVVVSGPETLQPGAPNEYHVRTYNLNQQHVPARLSARVFDETKRVVYEKSDITSPGDYQLVLPPDLPLKPDGKLSLEVTAQRDGASASTLREELELAAPVYLTHLYTDKPMYRPGETVYFRSLTLERFSLKPPEEDFQVAFTVKNPNGEEIFRHTGITRLLDDRKQALLPGPDDKPVHGIGAGVYPIPANAAGGEYTLTVSDAGNRFPPQQRKFIVNRYENPRLNKELDFTRKSYGPGDDVVASCKVSRVEGGVAVAQSPVTAAVFIDGKAYGFDGKEGGACPPLRTDDQGAVRIRFKLPRTIERGQGSLSIQFRDGGIVETLVRPIPIVLKKLQVDFFPEGGDLVAGVPNRVYFQVRTMLGKPGELKGRIVDQGGQVVVGNVQTVNDDKEPGVNQGLGSFTFTPQAGRQYELKIDAPDGIEGKYVLPEIKDDGVILNIPERATKAGGPIGVVVYSPRQERTLLVGAYCRGRLMDHQHVTTKMGKATVELHPPQDVGGVYRVTVFEEHVGQNGKLPRQFVPRAERLIYRTPAKQLILAAKPDRAHNVPGEKVALSFKALDEMEKPAPAILLVSVVDKSVITMADEKTARTMPTHYYLTTEVRKPEDLEYADFLLSPHPKAAEVLDLLLGTQGWRRFAEQNPGPFQKDFKEEAVRLLAANGQSSVKSMSLVDQEMIRFQTESVAQAEKLQAQLTKAEQELQAARNDAEFPRRQELLKSQIASTDTLVLESTRRLTAHKELAEKARSVAVLALSGVLLAGMGICLVLAVRRGLARAIPYYATAVGCCLLAAGLLALGSRNPVEPGDAFVMKDAGKDANAPDLSMPHVAPAPPDVDKPAMAERERLMDAAVPPIDPATLPPPAAPIAGMRGDRVAELKDELAGEAKDRTAKAMPLLGEKLMKEFEKNANESAPAREIAKGQNQLAKRAELPQEQDKAKGLLGQNRRMAPAAVPVLRFQHEAKDGMAQQKAAEAQLGMALKEDAKDAKRMATGKKQVADDRERGWQFGYNMPRGGPAQGNLGFGGGGFQGGQGNLGFGGFQGGMMPGGAGMPAKPGGLGGELMIGRDGKGDFRAGAMAAARAPAAPPPPPPPFVVRQYAHQRPTGSPSMNRTDFVDTIYWHPALVLPSGTGEVSFDLCDSVTTFQVTAFGHTLDGRIGAVTTAVESRLPLVLEPKLPIEVTASDKIDVPVSIANNTSEPRQVTLAVSPTGASLAGEDKAQLNVKADARARRLLRLQPSVVEGQARLIIAGESAPFTDSVTRTFQVVPEGFPFVGSRSDMLEGVAHNEVVLPETWVKGTLKCQVQVYPSTLADLQKGLEALLREPHGCFEQTSTSNYPNLLILDYLKESQQTKPELERRARDLLARGYQKLTSFECQDPGQNKRRGYEWFGGTAPPHEALTAYGLLQFRDMARVYDVDVSMVERTKQYLMSRKDGKGGFQRNPRALDTFGRAPDDITNAYIVWALTESGNGDDVEKELAALAAQAKTSKDPYFLSLVATSLLNRGKADEGYTLLKTVAAAQKEDGHLDAANTSITGSGGRDLQIETTALAALGWLKANRPGDFNVPVQKAIKWIGQQRGGYGGFGSTQSTILALKAVIAYTKANKKTAEGGELRLFAGNQAAAHLAFPAGAQEALVLNLPEPEKYLKPGKNAVRVEITGKNVFPYTLTWSYQTLKPVSAEQCAVRLNTSLDRATADEGETVHLTVTLENTLDKGQGMAVAIVGLPAGLTLPEDMKQLKDHALPRNEGKDRGLISAWETRGRELILYWRDLAPKQKIEVPLDLICRVPGEYSGPASRAYLYYNADRKHWIDPLQMTIKAKAE
jgi:hypothetical protein